MWWTDVGVHQNLTHPALYNRLTSIPRLFYHVYLHRSNMPQANMRGSLPKEMSALASVTTFNVYGNHLVGALPTLNYKDMTQCLLLTYPITNEPSCPFPPGVTSSCYQ